jgi:FHA domain-containing protein
LGLADEFERRLEQVVEGFFSKAFRSKLEPAEIGRRLLREMEGGRMVSVEAVYVPNRYTVSLSTTDHERFEGLIPELEKRFRGLLREAAQDRRWKLPGVLIVTFDQDESVKEGKFKVVAAHDSTAEAAADSVSSELRLVGDSKDWSLDADRMTIGRQEACDIVVPDPNASRRHAEVAKRDDGWWIVDLDSTNHTFVNGSLVKERRLNQGDRIRIGNTELEYHDSAAIET